MSFVQQTRCCVVHLLFAFAVLFWPSAQSRAADQVTPKSAQELIEAARDAVVVITQAGRGGGRNGVGTGFVISRDGLIATSLHVIGENRPVTVTFADGTSRPVTAIHAWDRKLDLAVIRVEASGLKTLRLGDSDNLKQGADIVAIGNPQGLTYSIVQGVVSAVREFTSGPMIQLAIPIEPGNSGGPLLDMRGRVQGILNMKSLLTRNLGFATPINALKPLLEKPNTVRFDKWLAMGELDAKLWKPIMGAQWRQKVGTITVEDLGTGFGGRALCLSQMEVPEAPYEIGVTVLLEDEAGAAGLAFGSDGEDRHYGFYPSAGQLRLTRFDGPSVYTWNILRQIDSPHYRPGEWNRLKVRVEPERIICYVNDHVAAEVEETAAHGKAGLAKFRDTRAKFKDFEMGRSVDAERNLTVDTAMREQLEKVLEEDGDSLPQAFSRNPLQGRIALLALAREKDAEAAEARRLARKVHQESVEKQMVEIFERGNSEVNLFKAAFQIARLEEPDLEIKAFLQEIDRLAGEARARFPSGAAGREKLKELAQYLFEDNGYHGSRSDYYNPANSFVNRVMEDREGIPITLAVLFLEVGRKAGIRHLEGMPFPGHFMVRYSDPAGDAVYIDVYDGGKFYSKNELYSLLASHSEVPLRDEHFKPATKREIVIRMLKNLVAVSAEEESATAALPYLDLLLAIAPDDGYERFRRASLRLRAGERSGARDDLKWMLDHRAAGFDLERVEELYRSLAPGP